MLTLLKLDEPNIIAFKLKGKLTKEIMQDILKSAVAELETPNHFSFYLEIESIEGMDFSVITEDLKFCFKHLGEYLKKLDKIAFVTDKKWLRFFATLEYSFIPWVDLKAFPLNEKKVAIDWINIPKED